MSHGSKIWRLAGPVLLGLFLFVPLGCDDAGDDEGTADVDADSDMDMDADSDSDSDSDSDADSDTDADSMAQIRVVHLSFDAPAVDVYAGSALVFEDLAYLSSTDYAEVEPGTYTFNVAPSDTSSDDSVLTLADVPLEAGKLYTAVAYGSLSKIKGMALADDVEGLADDEIRVRAIHLAEAVGDVDIWSIPSDEDAARLYDDVGFGAAGDYFDLPAAGYNLGFDVDDNEVPELIFSTPSLDAGTVANIFAVSDDDGVHLLAQLGGSTTAKIEVGESMIRVLHLSPDAPAVDVFIDGATDPAIEDLAFGKSTDYVPVAAAGYSFQVAAADTTADDAVLALDGVILLPDHSYTAVAYDELANISGMALMDDLEGLADESIRIRAIHTAAGVGEVDIWNVTNRATPGILWEDVPIAGVGSYFDLPVSAYTIGFDVDNDEVPDLTFDVPSLPNGTVANVFAVNDGAVKLLAQLDGGTTIFIPEKGQ